MNEFKKIKNNNETRYVLETMTAGATGASSIATVEKDIGEVQKRVPDAPKPRNFVAKNAKMGGAGKMKDKAKTIPRKEKHKKAIAEGFNGEYDDEAGMAKSNLLTSARAVMGLLKTIKDRDNLPEWGQEKIAKAEMMLVSVWDYLQSQKEMGNDPQVEVEEGERTMSRAAKGHEKYGKAGMAALAKAGRDGAGEEKLDAIRDKHDKYDEGVAEGSGPKEKQKTPYRDINSPEYRAAADKQKQRMAKDKAAEPGKKMLAKQGVAEGSEYKSRHAHKQEQDKAYADYRTKHNTSSMALMTRAEFAKDQRERAAKKKQGVAEVAGPEKCWPGHRKVGTKPGTGKNAGKRVNDCEKIGEAVEDRTSYQVAKILSDRGIKYDPSQENELINAIGMVLVKELMMSPKQARHLISYDEDFVSDTLGELRGMENSVSEVAPPGWEKTVKAMKKHKDIDNPFALAWSMKNKGYKSHKKESVDPYFESLKAKVDAAAKK